ncbi:hypothetical protein [Leisingera sp. ANG59]|uniref:hypothetical protein n=1 Tax=Leisingera sp. ANG59 TaxID=2675221 RepID=UPI00157485AD|nr:hypothetical protein [Leisingera sp. ANG59]
MGLCLGVLVVFSLTPATHFAVKSPQYLPLEHLQDFLAGPLVASTPGPGERPEWVFTGLPDHGVRQLYRRSWPRIGEDRTLTISSRIFAGPGEIPPGDYKAYGMLVFPSRPTADTRARFEVICAAFLNTIPHVTEVEEDEQAQIVTIWPAESVFAARRANRAPRAATCKIAIDNYGLAVSQTALKAAATSGMHRLTDRGPYLLAWAPGTKFGEPDAAILYRDLSAVESEQHAKDLFADWIWEIQTSPELWNTLPWHEKLRRRLQTWSDRNGNMALAVIKAILPKLFEAEA